MTSAIGPPRASLGRSSRSIHARILQIAFTLVTPLVVVMAIAAFYVYQNERDHITKSTIATSRALTSALNRELRSIGFTQQSCKALQDAKAIADALVNGTDNPYARLALA